MAGRSTTGEALWQRLHALGKAERDGYANGDGKVLPASQRYLLSSDVGIMAMIRMLANRVEELEGRLAELTENPLDYKGVWRSGESYPPRSFVTNNGQVFYTAVQTSRKPGEGDWVLAVRRGQDGRDAR